MVLLGQEGFACLMRSTCPLAAHTSSEEADYGLATYVMLSRPTKLEDVWIVDLPPRNVFEKFLHEHNPLLVQRMREFEGQACVDERKALKYVHRLSWQCIPWVSQHLSADEMSADLFA